VNFHEQRVEELQEEIDELRKMLAAKYDDNEALAEMANKLK